MRFLLTIFTVLYCTLSFVSCDNDDYVYPSVITEFIDACTDESGTLSSFRTDQGESLFIQPREGISGLREDTTYRTVSTYQIIDETPGQNRIMLYTCQLIPAMIPQKIENFLLGIKTDPVGIQSIWRSGEYLNMILLIKHKDQSHAFHFVDEGITVDADQNKTLNLRLYHNRYNDYEAFTIKYYLSVPLWHYKDILNEGDKIRFHINTYEEGQTVREFQY